MRINLKTLLNEEFEKITPSLDKRVKSTPISTVKRKTKVFNQKLFFRMALAATALVVGISIFCVSNGFFGGRAKSDVTCIITCDVQIVLEKDEIVSVSGLTDQAQAMITGVNSDDCNACELIERVIEAGLKSGYIKEFDSVMIEAVNNSQSKAAKQLETLQSNVSIYSVSIDTKTISMHDYNLKVFGTANVVDNLDEDKMAIIKR